VAPQERGAGAFAPVGPARNPKHGDGVARDLYAPAQDGPDGPEHVGRGKQVDAHEQCVHADVGGEVDVEAFEAANVAVGSFVDG